MRDHFIKRLSEMAKKDDSIVLITGDLGFGVFDEFRKELPGQFINAGVAEQNMTGLATGMALEGYKVFTYSIANFSTLRCLEQIRNDACYHDVNVNVVSIGGGFSYGSLGISHHATEDYSIMRSLPSIEVVSPSCYWETMEATEQLVNRPGASYLRLDKSSAGDTSKEGEVFEFGKIRELKSGNDVTLISSGGIMEDVLNAARVLEEKGISTRVLSVHSLKPFDLEAVQKAAKETRLMATVEEHTVDGGLGGLVAENLLEFGPRPESFKRIGLREGFSSIVGSQKYLRQRYDMDQDAIVNQVMTIWETL